MSKSNNERQSDLRSRRLALGLTRKEYYLTDSEAVKVAKYIKKLREKS